jgi:cell division protein FtsW (lipid II flippase)
VGVTVVTAADRDRGSAATLARQLDARHAVLAATSLFAVLAITIALAGRVRSDAAADRQPPSTAVINLNAVDEASALVPLFASVLTDDNDRRSAAMHLYRFIQSRREHGESLPNVGAILDATVDTTAVSRPLLTRQDLVAVKPLASVRTLETHRRQVMLWAAISIGCVWLAALFWAARGLHGDYLLLSATHLLTALAFAALVSRQDPLRDTMLFVRHAQLTSVGVLCFALVSAIDYRRLARAGLSYLPLAGALALSVVLILFGSGPAGSNARVNLGPLQPIEFIRLLLALFLAGYFAHRWDLLREVRGTNVRTFRAPRWLDLPRADYVIPVAAGVAASLLLFFLQKDLGPALFLSCVFLITYAIARNRAGLAVTGFALLVAGFYAGYALDISTTLSARMQMWQSTWDNAARGGDQIAQAIWSLSTGGLFGTGLGLGDTGYISAGHTDLMLAAMGEELGFVGLVAVAAIFVIIGARGFDAALRAADDYGFFLAMVLTLFLTLPVLVMAAGMLGLVPLTGVVTPFVSFGGSAMLANFVALGMLTAIGRRADSARPEGRALPAVTAPFHAAVRRSIAVFGVAAGVLLVALFDVQVIRADAYAARPYLGVQGDGHRRYQYNQRLTDVLAAIPRGTVFDRRGLPLATGDETVMRKARDLYKKAGVEITGCAPSGGTWGPPSGGPGSGGPRERCYPLGGAAFHLLGDARDGRNWSASNSAYIERDAQDRLRGFDDHATTVMLPNASGKPVPAVQRDYSELIPLLRHRHSPASSTVEGFLNRSRDVTLTIDAPLQASVANILTKYAGRSATGRAAAVVINPDTGDVLASGSYPFPTLGVETAGEREEEPESVIDRARFGLYPPGSTFKLVTASAALRQSLSLRDSTFMCSLQGNGRVGARVDGTIVRDDVLDRDPHGKIDMREGLVHSCNAYFAQLAVRVGPTSILDTAHLLGISVARDDSVARLRATLPQAGYGQGDVVATPLRMARVAAAIASNGVLRDTRVIASKTSTDSQVLLTPGAASTLGRYLRDSVLTGTGRSLRTHPWRIAGKTGTAEVHGAQSHAWFIGYAPYGPAQKRVAFAVLIENAGYGGSAAAPAAGEIVSAAAASGLVK